VRALSLGAALLVLAAGCGGKSADPDRTHERQVTGAIGIPATVHCSRSSCAVTTVQPLRTTDEAWLIALPVVSGVDGEPNLSAVDRLDLEVMDRSGSHEARFACDLRRGNGPSSGALVTVELIHDLCEGSFSGF
jgi:hypothetical protein